jgi:hypothetical protein
MMGSIMANAASVAAGSVMGHGISRMIWGGSSDQAQAQDNSPPAAAGQPVNQQAQFGQYQQEGGAACAGASQSESFHFM